jgi:hypothetical protein
MEDEEMEEVDNKKDFDIEYEAAGDVDIAAVESMSFVSTQGWDPDTLVDYRINEDEFHKISLLDCDFFIRKPPDPDNDVYDFREVGSLLLCYCHPFHSTSTSTSIFVVTYYFNCVEYFLL